jgi:hypothetical protein
MRARIKNSEVNAEFPRRRPRKQPKMPERTGAVERNRTSDLLITNQLLYQLSYNSMMFVTKGAYCSGLGRGSEGRRVGRVGLRSVHDFPGKPRPSSKINRLSGTALSLKLNMYDPNYEKS